MKVLLLSPLLFDATEYGSPPLGIAYIAAVLEEKGYDVNLIDMHNYTWEEVQDTLEQSEYDIVGITTTTKERPAFFQLANLVHSILPNATIVAGGPHATFMAEQVLLNSEVDIIVMGEGEITIVDLVRAIEDDKNLKEVRGIAFVEHGKVVVTESRGNIENLDILPFPARHFFNMREYPLASYYRRNTSHYKYPVDEHNILRLTAVSSRGCIAKCQFCSSTRFWGLKWRARSAQNVVDELEFLQKSYSPDIVTFSDDVFTLSEKRVINICREILRRDLKLNWNCEGRVKPVSEEMLELMKEAGCFSIAYGVESGSEEMLERLSKNITKDDILRAFQLTKKADISTVMLLMVGNPGESDRTIQETKKLISLAQPDIISPAITMIFPGTPLYELAKVKGLIDDEYWLSEKPPMYYTGDHELEKLQYWYDELMTHWRSEISSFPMAMIRKIRNRIAMTTGIKITRNGIEWKNSKRL